MSATLLNYTRCPGVPTISAIAHQLGLMEQEFANDRDLAPVYKVVGFSPQLEYGHDERFWIRNAGHAPAVWKRSKGVDCKMVGLAFLEGSYPVLALKSSGIRSVADLAGKRLAVIGRRDGTFDLMINQQLKIYKTTLATAGLTLDDVEIAEFDQRPWGSDIAKSDIFLSMFRDRIDLLEAGEVDAVATSIPPDAGDYPTLNILYDTRLHPNPLERVNPSVLRGLAVSGPLLAERRDVVVRILARLLEAAEWARTNPLEALRLVAKDLGFPPELLAASYENIAQGVQIDIDEDKIAALDVQKRFLLQHGLIETDFDLASWVDASPLAEARTLLESRRTTPMPEDARSTALVS
jgi:ABC-type nitrate/sulfonate/bicarbonate transport system substrate-binding protein